MEYELDVLRTPHMTSEQHDDLRVTVWFLDKDGKRTGLYIRIIEDGRVTNMSGMEEFYAITEG